MVLSTPTSKSSDSELIALAQYMAGDFSNQKQAANAPAQFAHIRIFFRPLPYEFFSGIGFYSEQAYDYDLWSPYRQGIHRFVAQGDQVYVENYGLKDGYIYAGSGHNRDILQTITPDIVTRREGCSMVFKREGDGFVGGVEPGKACLIPRDGKITYLTSYVKVTDSTWVSLDQGMDLETDEHVWGSTEGMLSFEKRESFAVELPQLK